MIRYNTTSHDLEGYVNSVWRPINTSAASLTTINGLDVWADVTDGISSTSVTDQSGNNRTGTLSSASSNGTFGNNTYHTCSSNNYIQYGVGAIPNYSSGVTYFFVITNVQNFSGHRTLIGTVSNSSGYQIIRTPASGDDWNYYWSTNSNVNTVSTNTNMNSNSTIGTSSQIMIFSFGAPATGNLTIHKRTGGAEGSDTYGSGTFNNTSNHNWTANGAVTRIGNSSWADEELAGGVFAWGIIDHEITSAEKNVIYDYYAAKGLGN
jgi:hypothetical protein